MCGLRDVVTEGAQFIDDHSAFFFFFLICAQMFALTILLSAVSFHSGPSYLHFFFNI